MTKQNTPILSRSEEDNAPWNEVVNPPRKVDVTVTMTISKTFTVETTEYTMEKDIDKDGNVGVIYKYADGALERAVDEQVTLPNQAYDELHHAVFLTEDYQARDSMEDLEGWFVEDLQVDEALIKRKNGGFKRSRQEPPRLGGGSSQESSNI